MSNGEMVKDSGCARLSTQDAKREVYLSGIDQWNSQLQPQELDRHTRWYTKDVPLIGVAKTAAAARQNVCGDRSLNGLYRCGTGQEQEK